MGIRDKPTAPASPWQNGCAERLIGSIRRECVDHIIVLGEAHLRRILRSYADYYNRFRTHRSLNKDTPNSRPVQSHKFVRHLGRTSSPLWPDLRFSVHTEVLAAAVTSAAVKIHGSSLLASFGSFAGLTHLSGGPQALLILFRKGSS